MTSPIVSVSTRKPAKGTTSRFKRSLWQKGILVSKRSKIARKANKRPKVKTVSKLKKELDAIFSRYIRTREKGKS